MLLNGRVAAIGVLIAVTVVPAHLAAQDLPPRSAPTVRAMRGTIRVDGRLDDLVYGTTEAIGSFAQQEPDEGKPATERTEAWIWPPEATSATTEPLCRRMGVRPRNEGVGRRANIDGNASKEVVCSFEGTLPNQWTDS